MRPLNNKGFTLLEAMLYMAMLSILSLVSSQLLLQMMQARIRHQVITEVNEQGWAAMAMITQTVRNAENITSPSVGSAATSATVDALGTVDDPTVYSLVGTTLTVQEAGGEDVPLSSPLITASDLQFKNLSSDGSPGNIRIWFTLTYYNPSGRATYNYSKTFYGSASLRQP